MILKLFDKSGLIIIFIVGGLYGFTDFKGPKDMGTFLGSAMVVMFLSIGIGWIVNKLLRMFAQYKDRSDKVSEKIDPTIVIAVISSLLILISGVIELNSY